MSKALKILGILVLVWVGVVIAFESLIGYMQPREGSAIVITTFDEDGTAHDRVVSLLASDGQSYVAANHWPRAWYNRALENPEMKVERDGETSEHRAVPVEGEEHQRVHRDNPTGTVFRILTGFPPRRFVRLEPPVPGTGG